MCSGKFMMGLLERLRWQAERLISAGPHDRHAEAIDTGGPIRQLNRDAGFSSKENSKDSSVFPDDMDSRPVRTGGGAC